MWLSEYLRVVWRRKWRILAASLVLAMVVYARSDSQPDRYRAESLLAVTAGGTSPPSAAGFLARSYAELARTRQVVARAVADGGLAQGTSTARDGLAVGASGDGYLRIEAEGPSPRRAEQLAAAVAEALRRTVADRQQEARREVLEPAETEMAELERQLASRDPGPDSGARTAVLARYGELARAVTAVRLTPPARVDVVSPARAASAPVAPEPAGDGLVTLVAALAAFSLLAVAVEASSDRFSTERPGEEVTRVTGLPVLAEVPRAGATSAVEAFRTLRTGLMFMSTSERLRTLAVVGVDPGSGKTFTALNLAREAAALEVPVVLIDADLRRPRLHERLGLARSPGLSDALAGGFDPSGLGGEVGGWLRFVPSGSGVPDPAGLLGGRAFREALDAMSWAELVVVDTPAGGLFADALAIASQCDATVVVVDAQAGRRRPVRRLVEHLRQVGAQPIGVVVNRTEARVRPASYAGSATKAAGVTGAGRSSAQG